VEPPGKFAAARYRQSTPRRSPGSACESMPTYAVFETLSARAETLDETILSVSLRAQIQRTTKRSHTIPLEEPLTNLATVWTSFSQLYVLDRVVNRGAPTPNPSFGVSVSPFW